MKTSIRSSAKFFIWAGAFLVLVVGGFAKSPQPMLLRAGKVSIKSGQNSAKVSAKCLDVNLSTPEFDHRFTHSTKGIKITKKGEKGGVDQTVDLGGAMERDWIQPRGNDSTDEVIFELGKAGLESGAQFDIEVMADSPQYLGTGAEQMSDVGKFMTARSKSLSDFDKLRPQLEGSLGQAETDEILQGVIWDLKEQPDLQLDRIVKRQVGYQLEMKGLPRDPSQPESWQRFELARGRQPTPEEIKLVETVLGKPVPRTPGQIEGTIRLSADVKGYSLWDGRGGSQGLSLDEACAAIKKRRPSVANVIFDGSERGLLGSRLSEAEASALARIGVNHVIDADYFAAVGIPAKPQRIIVIASKDEAKNLVIFEDQDIGAIKKALAELDSLGEKVIYADSAKKFEAELALAASDEAPPWIIGHNTGNGFRFPDGEVSFLDISIETVNVSCSLFASDAAVGAMRTTTDLDFLSVCKAASQAWAATAGKSGGEFYTEFGPRYAAAVKSRDKTIRFIAMGLASTLGGGGIYVVVEGEEENDDARRKPEDPVHEGAR